jgi:sulfite reductase alpha subunit-like flavoprotein
VSSPCLPEKKALEALIADDATYENAILKKQVSVLDLLEHYQSSALPFAAFLQIVCGDGRRMAPAVHETCVRIYQEATNSMPEVAEQWMVEMERNHGRYVADVFA